MIPVEEIENRVKSKINATYIKAVDLRGGDHIQLILASPEFEGKNLVEQHQAVYAALAEELRTNEIHALALKTFSTSEWDKVKDSMTTGVDHQI